jgi:hypothetical protein
MALRLSIKRIYRHITGWDKRYNEKLQNDYFPHIVMVIKSLRAKWEIYVACM